VAVLPACSPSTSMSCRGSTDDLSVEVVHSPVDRRPVGPEVHRVAVPQSIVMQQRVAGVDKHVHSAPVINKLYHAVYTKHRHGASPRYVLRPRVRRVRPLLAPRLRQSHQIQTPNSTVVGGALVVRPVGAEEHVLDEVGGGEDGVWSQGAVEANETMSPASGGVFQHWSPVTAAPRHNHLPHTGTLPQRRRALRM